MNEKGTKKKKKTEAKLVPVLLKFIEYSEILKLIKLNNAT